MSRSNTRQVCLLLRLPLQHPLLGEDTELGRSHPAPAVLIFQCFFQKPLSKILNSLILPLFALGIKLCNGRFLELQSRFMAETLLRAGVRYHSLPSAAATAACDREAAHKWSREGKHLFRASRYTDHLQIAQLAPDFPRLCLATRSSAQTEADGAPRRRAGAGQRPHSIPATEHTARHGLRTSLYSAPLQKASSGFAAGVLALSPQSQVSPAPGVSRFPFSQVPRARSAASTSHTKEFLIPARPLHLLYVMGLRLGNRRIVFPADRISG